MRARFAQAFKDKNDLKVEEITTRELTSAVNAVRLIIVKKEYAELLSKEAIGCLLATD